MTLKQKIDKILADNDLGINSATELEDFIGAGQGSITTPIRESKSLGPKITRLLHEKVGVNKKFVQTGELPVFVGVPTKSGVDIQVQKESFYKELIEDNEEYNLIPRAILHDYKIVPEKIIDMIYRDKEEIKQALISKYEVIIDGLKEENERLRARAGDPS